MPTKKYENHPVHIKALAVAKAYKQAKIDLINILTEVDSHKIYYGLNYPSLFKYAVNALELSESVAYIFINVARKAEQVPALKKEIELGQISVSKAKKLTGVITKENSDSWLKLAKTSTQAHLEKEVAKVSPNTAVRDELKFTHAANEITESFKPQPGSNEDSRVQLKAGISENTMIKLRRAQDVLSQKRKRPVSIEEVIEATTEAFLQKADPREQAKRYKERVERKTHLQGKKDIKEQPLPTTKKKKTKKFNRRPVSKTTKHQLYLKDEGRCSFINKDGARCDRQRHLEIHHIKPVSMGGSNELSNLTLLCSGHHKALHLNGS